MIRVEKSFDFDFYSKTLVHDCDKSHPAFVKIVKINNYLTHRLIKL
jgi:hypothetical protein